MAQTSDEIAGAWPQVEDLAPVQELTILLISATPDFASALKTILSQARGIKRGAMRSSTPGEALDRLQAERFDAVLVDLDTSSPDIAKAIHDAASYMPVIALTASDDEA